jgi:hypothetical protein
MAVLKIRNNADDGWNLIGGAGYTAASLPLEIVTASSKLRLNYETTDFSVVASKLTIINGGIDHNALANYVASEHTMWSQTGAENIHVDRIASTAVTQWEGSIDHNALTNTHNLTTDIDHNALTNTHNLTTNIDHDALTNFVASEHVALGNIDHGSIAGLAGDDHSAYPLVTNFEADRATTASRWTDLTGGGDTSLHTHAGGVDISGTPEALDFARFTDADTIEGREYSEVRTDLGLVIGTNVLAEQTIGIANDNLVEMDDADAANLDYCRLTTNGIEGRAYSEVRTDLGIDTNDHVVFGSLTTGDTIIGDHGIQIDMVPDANGEWCGTYVDATVDANAIGFGGAMHMDSDSHWINADADGTTTMPCLGISVEAGTGTRKVLMNGFVKNTAWAWTPGAILFASATVGLFTHTAPAGTGDQVQSIGIAIDADTIYFNPSTVLVERT